MWWFSHTILLSIHGYEVCTHVLGLDPWMQEYYTARLCSVRNKRSHLPPPLCSLFSFLLPTPRSYAYAHHPAMRKTLRRSCDACAKSKLSCDLRTPKCSRCIKRKADCNYANQPLTSTLDESASLPLITSPETDDDISQVFQNSLALYSNPGTQLFDPFDSYPQTRLPRVHVQRLIQHCKTFICAGKVHDKGVF